MTIVNLTPHPLVIERAGVRETIPSSGIARCATTERVVGDIEGIPIVITEFGAVEGLPDPGMRKNPRCPGEFHLCPEEVVYVVSSITAQAVPDRKDVFVPARPIRDEQGRIVACSALGRINA